MRRYIRARIEGGTYFFTANLAQRGDNSLLVDRIDAFRHADMREVERLVDGSTANIIVVSDGATADAIAEVARSRGRVVLPFSSADIDLLKREVQRAQPPRGL